MKLFFKILFTQGTISYLLTALLLHATWSA